MFTRVKPECHPQGQITSKHTVCMRHNVFYSSASSILVSSWLGSCKQCTAHHPPLDIEFGKTDIHLLELPCNTQRNLDPGFFREPRRCLAVRRWISPSKVAAWCGTTQNATFGGPQGNGSGPLGYNGPLVKTTPPSLVFFGGEGSNLKPSHPWNLSCVTALGFVRRAFGAVAREEARAFVLQELQQGGAPGAPVGTGQGEQGLRMGTPAFEVGSLHGLSSRSSSREVRIRVPFFCGLF